MEFLDYLSLGILCMGLTVVFYGFIYIHDIPAKIAEKRHHPHAEAIHVACWLSLFTLHAIWPIVFIWAIMKEAPFAFAKSDAGESLESDVLKRLTLLEQRIAAFESSAPEAGKREAISHD